MGTIEFVIGTPSPFSSHVMIVRTRGLTYRFDGVSNAPKGEPRRFASRHYGDLEEAKLAAAQWADANGIRVIYLPRASQP